MYKKSILLIILIMTLCNPALIKAQTIMTGSPVAWFHPSSQETGKVSKRQVVAASPDFKSVCGRASTWDITMRWDDPLTGEVRISADIRGPKGRQAFGVYGNPARKIGVVPWAETTYSISFRLPAQFRTSGEYTYRINYERVDGGLIKADSSRQSEPSGVVSHALGVLAHEIPEISGPAAVRASRSHAWPRTEKIYIGTPSLFSLSIKNGCPLTIKWSVRHPDGRLVYLGEGVSQHYVFDGARGIGIVKAEIWSDGALQATKIRRVIVYSP